MTYFYDLDFTSGNWKSIPIHLDGTGYPSLWSPNGQWFIFRVGERTYLWDVNHTDMANSVQIPHQNRFASPKGWTNDSKYLIFQDGAILYAVDPTIPQSPTPLIDLAAMGITGDPQPTMNLWFPPIR